MIFSARAMMRVFARVVADDGNGVLDYTSALFARAVDPDEDAGG